MTADEIRTLIRLSLFDVGPATTEVDQTTGEIVIKRLLKAMNNHLEDDSEKFATWFFKKADNIVHRISKQKKNGGPIDRKMVRQVMLETIFYSFQYLGGCLQLAMGEIDQSLPDVINANAKDVALFDDYRQQPVLGNLPLKLLELQMPVLSTVLPLFRNMPDTNLASGTLLRYLQSYAEMVQNKRASEKYYKSQSKPGGEVVAPQDVNSQSASGIGGKFQEIAAELREIRKTKCPCGTTREWYAEPCLEESDHPSKLVWQDRCTECGFEETVEATKDQMKKMRQDLDE